MIEYILIAIIYQGDYNPAFEMQEFSSRATCEKAKRVIDTNFTKRSARQVIVCIEK